MGRPTSRRKRGTGRHRKSITRRLLPGARRRRWWGAFKRAPSLLQFFLCVAVVGTLWLLTNGLYQVLRKPTELFFPVSGTLYKTPAETWNAYGYVFRQHS